MIWPYIAREIANGSHAVVHMSEAWVAEVLEEEWRKDKRPVGERDDRKEKILLEAKDRDGNHVMLNQEFEHDWDGKIKWVGEVTEIEIEKAKGFRSYIMDGVY